jgi:hypothetical protein
MTGTLRQMEPTIESKVKKKSTIKVFIRDSIALLLWAYLFVKLFIFDFDVYAVEVYLPSLAWLVHFKFLVFLVLMSIYLLSVGDKNFLKSVGFVLIYPFFLIFWRIPRLLLRNWMLLFGTTSYLISFFRSFKSNLLTFTVFAVASTVILVSSENSLLVIAATVLSIYLLIHYGKRVRQSFAPAGSLFLPKDSLIRLLNKTKTQYRLPEDLKTVLIDDFTPDQRSKWVNNLQILVLVNKVTLYVASNLREIQERRIILVYFIVGLVLTLVLTTLIFALDYFALYKCDKLAFAGAMAHGFLFFVYYSANDILTNGIADFYPVSSMARFLSTVELYFGIFILIILFFLYTNIRNDRTKSELDGMIKSLNDQGKELELYVNNEFSVDIDRAMEEMARIPGSIIKVIYFFTTRKV